MSEIKKLFPEGCAGNQSPTLNMYACRDVPQIDSVNNQLPTEEQYKQIEDNFLGIKEEAKRVAEKTDMSLEEVYEKAGVDIGALTDLVLNQDHYGDALSPEEYSSMKTDEISNFIYVNRHGEEKCRPDWFEYLDGNNPSRMQELKNKIKTKTQKYKGVGKAAAAIGIGFGLLTAFSGCLGLGDDVDGPSDHVADQIYTQDGEVYTPDQIDNTTIHTESMNLSDYNVVDSVPFGQDLPNNETVAMEQALEQTVEKALETEGADAIFVDTWKNPVFGGSNSGVGLRLNKTNQSSAMENLADLVSLHFNLPTVDLNKGIPANYSLGLGPTSLFTLRDSDNDGVPDYKDIDDNNNGIPDVNETGFREKPRWQLFNDSVITQQVNPNLDPEDQIKALGILRTQKENFREALVYQLQGPSKDTKVPVNYY